MIFSSVVAPSDSLPLVDGITPHFPVTSSYLCSQLMFPDAKF